MKRLLSWLAIATEKFTTLISWRITLPLTALLFVTQCAKELPDNPVPSGTHYFICKVNGSEWVASTPSTISGPMDIQVQYNPASDGLSITAVRKTQNESMYDRIYFYCINIHDNQQVAIFPGEGELTGFVDFVGNVNCGQYFHDPSHPGEITILSHDTVNRKIKADFSFILRNPNCADSIMNVTEGAFSLSY